MSTRLTTRQLRPRCFGQAALTKAFSSRRSRAKPSRSAPRSMPECSSAAASPAPRRSCSICSTAIICCKNDLVFIGSPQTVAAKIRAAARSRPIQRVHGRIQFRRSAGGRTDALDSAVRRESHAGAEGLRAVLRTHEFKPSDPAALRRLGTPRCAINVMHGRLDEFVQAVANFLIGKNAFGDVQT